MVGMFYCAKLLRPGQRQVPLTLSVGGLDGSLPQFFRAYKNWVFRQRPLTPHLPFAPLCPQCPLAHKTVLPTKKLKELHNREKNRTLKHKEL